MRKRQGWHVGPLYVSRHTGRRSPSSWCGWVAYLFGLSDRFLCSGTFICYRSLLQSSCAVSLFRQLD